MADSDSKYKDSFISQDDLDRLMKEAENLGPEAFDGPSPEGGGAPVSASAEDDEVISQDDIDALLNLAGSDKDTTDADQKDDDVISQEDIDALMAGSSKPDPAPAEENGDDEVISQDDIDALLAGSQSPSTPSETPEDSDLSMVSEEDIEQLLRAEGLDISSEPAPDPEAPSSEFETITQEDLRDLSNGNEIKADAGPDTGDDDDSLISQEDIDALLAGAGEKTRVDEPEAPAASPAPEPEPPAASNADEEDSLISQDDIDSLLAGAGVSDTPEEAEESEDSNLISQEDIDKLLLGKTDEEGVGETLVGQEDIDRLLSATSPVDDETISEAAGQDKLISQEDIDKLLNEDVTDGEKDEDRILDQVVLEHSPAEETADEGGKPSAWYTSKLFISAVAVSIVLVVSITALMMFSKKPDKDLAVEEQAIETMPRAVEEEPLPDYVDSGAPQPRAMVTVTMNDFVVPAPAEIKGLSYIALSLTMEIADVTSNPIKDYEPFFRNIVYEVIIKAFILQSEAKIVEADLKKMIKNALNDALSEGSVSTIEFLEFKVG